VYTVKSHSFIRAFYSNFIWRMKPGEGSVYLTFDDGPHPEITPAILDILKKANARATFFCIGSNVARYPEIYRRIVAEGHRTGNHTWSHLNGWKVDKQTYLNDVVMSEEYVSSHIFRPPYGKIKRGQARELQRRFSIIMWDVLSGDFDPTCTPEQCLRNVESHTQDGSIVVFHDNEKARKNVLYALPRVFKSKKFENFVFDKLPDQAIMLNVTQSVPSRLSV